MFAVNGESQTEIFQDETTVVASPHKSGKFTNFQLSQLNRPKFTSDISFLW